MYTFSIENSCKLILPTIIFFVRHQFCNISLYLVVSLHHNKRMHMIAFTKNHKLKVLIENKNQLKTNFFQSTSRNIHLQTFDIDVPRKIHLVLHLHLVQSGIPFLCIINYRIICMDINHI